MNGTGPSRDADDARAGGARAAGCQPLFLSAYGAEPCGVSAFTRDLADAYDLVVGRRASSVASIARGPVRYLRDDRVLFMVRDEVSDACRQVATLANEHPCTVVSLQHEHGCHPGAWAEAALEFAQACRKPMVVTFHTLCSRPEPPRRQSVRALAELCQRVVATTAAARGLMTEVYGLPPEQVVHIPRATHHSSCDDQEWLRHRLSIPGGPLMMTAGPLCRQMGVEFMIDALPRVIDRCPNAACVVVGRTHRTLRAVEGEGYREGLKERARRLGVLDRVRFVDRSLTLHEMLLYMKSADVFVSPCVGADGITAGTLACAAAAGKAIVATPCIYGQEMAASEAVLLAERGDGAALAAGVLSILDDAALRERLEGAVLRFSDGLRWEGVAAAYRDLFGGIAATGLVSRQTAG